MTRIIAGDLGGRRLETPPGHNTRPTSDRVREALFGALTAAGALVDARVLDLYAGSGAVGLEACSRGAAHAVLVESHARTARLLRHNVDRLGLRGRAEVVAAGVTTLLARPATEPFDVVFADPPYDLADTAVAEVLTALVAGGWVAGGGDVVVERSSRTGPLPWPDGITGIRSRRYGESTLWYGRRSWN